MVSTTTLKNAAKALGYDLWSDPDASHYLVDYDGVKLKRWDPEHDDGDALRLAVKLGIGINFYPDHDSVAAHIGSGEIVAEMDDYGTRYAIVMIAAEIGRTGP